MNWTYEQKIAVLKTLFFIAGADGNINDKEISYFSQYANLMNLPIPQAQQEADQLNNLSVAHIIRNMAKEDRDYIMKLWIGLVKCDGNVNDREIEMIADIALDCNVNLP